MRVEVAGRLVGEHHRRPRDERAGDRDALLLAAGELRRPVRAALGETDRWISSSTHARSGFAPAIESGSRMFSSAVSIGSRLKNWKTKPMCRRRSFVSSCRPSSVISVPAIATLPPGRLVEPGEDVHERRLAGPRRAHHGGELAAATSSETPRSAFTQMSPADARNGG